MCERNYLESINELVEQVAMFVDNHADDEWRISLDYSPSTCVGFDIWKFKDDANGYDVDMDSKLFIRATLYWKYPERINRLIMLLGKIDRDLTEEGHTDITEKIAYDFITEGKYEVA